MKQTFPELAEMCGKTPVVQQKRQWSLTVYASSKSLNVCSILQGQIMQGDTEDESNFIQLLKLRGKDQPFKMVRDERRQIQITRYSK